MVSVHNGHRKGGTHENQGCVKIFVVLLDIHIIVLVRLSFVHGVEIELGIIGLEGLEVRPQGLLDTTWRQLVYPCGQFRVSATHHRGSILTGLAF